MQIISFPTSSSSSSSSEGRHCEEKGMDKFEPHPLSPPSPPNFKGKQHHRHRQHPPHSPPPPHRHHHHHHHDVELRHGSPPPPPPPPPPHCSHHERGKLRVKPPKHSKKVRKLHHVLMKGCKRPKGARHGHKHHHHHMQFPPPEGGFLSGRVDGQHPPGCCLHVDTCNGDDKLGEGQRPHGMGHHHRRRRRRRRPHHSHPPHAHKWDGPCIRSEVVGVAEAIMWPNVAAAAVPADTPVSGAPPPASTILPADEAARAP